VERFAVEHGAARRVTTASPSPRFAEIAAVIGRSLAVEVVPGASFVAYDGRLDLGRFGKYWRVARRHVFGQLPLFDEDAKVVDG